VGVWAKSFADHIWDSKLQLQTRFSAKVKDLGFTLNKQTRLYEAKTEGAAV